MLTDAADKARATTNAAPKIDVGEQDAHARHPSQRPLDFAKRSSGR